VDINDGIQSASRNALSTAVVTEDAADEPPCSGKQARQLSLTLSQDSASTPTAAVSTQTPEHVTHDPKEHDFAFNIENINPKTEETPSKRKIRFKVPLTLPRLSKRSPLRALFTPTRTIGPAPSYGRSIINILRFSPLNVLLVFIPISWALHFAHQPNAVVFATSALSILPLAALLGFVTEQVAIRTSSAVAALLNASLGNLTELIIAGICLSRCELQLVQTTLLGGLLSNLLLVLGMAFVVGGFRYPQLSFRPAAAQVNASLLTVGVIAMLVPTAFVSHLFRF
jgi:Ca2+:H+ antiporter